jgi:hypothetical protein
MFILAMTRPPSKIPAMVTLTAACTICIAVVFINISAQSQPASDPMAVSQSAFSWIIAAAGCITLLIGIGYGFLKKQKYENLETERDELKSIADSREERIKELKAVCEATENRLKLQIAGKDTTITNLKESNSALVSQGLQMKAILRRLRLEGIWQGDEERIHETQ